MSKLAFLTVPALFFVLAACGGKSVADGADAGGSATGGTGTGGSALGGTGTGANSAGGNGQAAAPSTCARYDDESPASVTVAITNKTGAPISVGTEKVTCEVPPLFQVADANGTSLSPLSRCRSSCVGLRREGAGGCTTICLFPTSVTLEPGEVRLETWDGLFSSPGSLPSSCLPFDPGQPSLTCDQAKLIQPGEFTFSAQAGTSLDCSQTSGAGNCAPCMADGKGGCSTPGALLGGKLLTATSTVTLDASYGIYGSSTNADPGAGASPNGSRALAFVDLVFNN